MIALNVPVAIFCYRHIGKKFVIFSMIQVFLASFLLKLSLFEPLFEDALLNIWKQYFGNIKDFYSMGF